MKCQMNRVVKGQPPDADSEGSTKSISHSLNEDSDSEGVLNSGHKNRRTRVSKPVLHLLKQRMP